MQQPSCHFKMSSGYNKEGGSHPSVRFIEVYGFGRRAIQCVRGGLAILDRVTNTESILVFAETQAVWRDSDL